MEEEGNSLQSDVKVVCKVGPRELSVSENDSGKGSEWIVHLR